MSALEARRRQATVDRLIDDLRHLVEEERGDRQPGEARHERAERLRWEIAQVVRSTASEGARATTRPERRGRGVGGPPAARRRLRRGPAGGG
jgi:hypothetical protein